MEGEEAALHAANARGEAAACPWSTCSPLTAVKSNHFISPNPRLIYTFCLHFKEFDLSLGLSVSCRCLPPFLLYCHTIGPGYPLSDVFPSPFIPVCISHPKEPLFTTLCQLNPSSTTVSRNFDLSGTFSSLIKTTFLIKILFSLIKFNASDNT